MTRRAGTTIRRMIQKRKLPGMLVFDADGQLLSSSPAAEQMLYHGQSDRLIRSIRTSLKGLKSKEIKGKDQFSSPAGPILQETLATGRRTYGIQAFMLNHQPMGRNQLVAVLFERVNSNRLDPTRARRRFGLSAREFEVIQALKIGMSDKEIASSLGVGFETIRDYLKNIRAKLGVSTRTAILNTVLSN